MYRKYGITRVHGCTRAYVQEVRYNAGAWMHKSVYVQEVRYNAGAWMHKSVYVQEVRYNAGA